jgi:hypothetical protein
MVNIAFRPGGRVADDAIFKPFPYVACGFWVLPNWSVCETIFSGKFAVNRSFE